MLGTLTLAAVAVVVPVGPAQAAVTHVWPVCRKGTEGGWTYNTRTDHVPQNAVDINWGSYDEDKERIVVASAAGTLVAKAEYGSGYGDTLTIKHSDGTYSFYAHLKWRTTLSVGASIYKGRPIASIGQSGGQEYSHLHYEQRTGTSSGSAKRVVINGNQLTYFTDRKSFTPGVACT